MTGKEFIQDYLIDGIGDLVETKPFFAFTLMALGIEFLGKCLNTNDWDYSNSTSDFNAAINSYDPLKKYVCNDIDLYHNLRCGLAHFFMVKPKIKLGPDGNNLGTSPIQIGCKEFYKDFRQACEDAINNKGVDIKKNIEDEFYDESDGITSNTISNSTTI